MGMLVKKHGKNKGGNIIVKKTTKNKPLPKRICNIDIVVFSFLFFIFGMVVGNLIASTISKLEFERGIEQTKQCLELVEKCNNSLLECSNTIEYFNRNFLKPNKR